MSTHGADIAIESVSALGGLAAAVAAWWAARIALQIASQDRQLNADRDAQAEARTVLGDRVERLLALMAVAERAAQEGGAWVFGEGRRTSPHLRSHGDLPDVAIDGPASAELRARLLLTSEYLPLSRALVLEGMPFSAGDASAPFEALEEELDDDNGWWLELELNEVDAIGLQVFRAEILLAVRGLERARNENAVSSAAATSVLTGWQLARSHESKPSGQARPSGK